MFDKLEEEDKYEEDEKDENLALPGEEARGVG